MTISLQDHQDIIVAQLRRLSDRLKPSISKPKVAIMVNSGLHDGMSQGFEENSICIGSSSECDMVLVDEGIADRHVQLTFDWSLFGRIAKIQTAHQDVTLNGEVIDGVLKVSLSTKTFDLKVGDVFLRLSVKKTPEESRSTWGRVVRDLRIPVVVLGVLMLSLAAPVDRWFNFGRGSGFEIVRTQPQLNPITVHTDTVHDGVSDLEKINTTLAESGFEKFITVTASKDNFVLLKGTLPLGRFLEWQEVQKMFDGSLTDVFLLSEVTAAPELSNFPPVESVRLMDPAMITFSNGLVAGVGDTVVDGWNIVAIESDNLQLSNGGDFITVEF